MSLLKRKLAMQNCPDCKKELGWDRALGMICVRPGCSMFAKGPDDPLPAYEVGGANSEWGVAASIDQAEQRARNEVFRDAMDEISTNTKRVNHDSVRSPTHYNQYGIECIDAIEASMSPVEFQGYCKGNSLKYLWRYRYKKNPEEDLEKSEWYSARLRASLAKFPVEDV